MDQIVNGILIFDKFFHLISEYTNIQTIIHHQTMPYKKKQSQNTTTNIHNSTSPSNIFSDVSKALYREQSFNRKIKHLITDNTALQSRIKEYAEQIKDQRTIVIYQMMQLNKAVNSKLGDCYYDKEINKDLIFNNNRNSQINHDNHSVHKTNAKNKKSNNSIQTVTNIEDPTHYFLKQLMKQYEQVYTIIQRSEKQSKMMIHTRQKLQKLQGSYTSHQNLINTLINQAIQYHYESQNKLNEQIQQKKRDILNKKGYVTKKKQQIISMREQLEMFEYKEPVLKCRAKQLEVKIKERERVLEERTNKFKEMSQWAKFVIDKKQRNALYAQLKQKQVQLVEIKQNNGKLGLKYCEQTMLLNQQRQISSKEVQSI